ncbi:MAG: glycosyltransferase family 2 protein [Alphaproteobacteria bacterium]|nr:glycosyltransferase family 2 protein [Alphaproteobacteria bacterium]MBV8549512.1 glycosyltransferase family 2 protein [Alphaproteobacteria bacterium]
MTALSVVIPLLNESGNVMPLIDEISAALNAYAPTAGQFEIICVDDGSTDTTATEVRQAQEKHSFVRLVRHPRSLGMSAALRNGIRRANSVWILTIDGDRQNDPNDAAKLLDIAWAGGKTDRKILVGGIRVNRRDTWGKRFASKYANKIRRAALKDNCPDTGCSLKVFPRDSYLELPFFNGLHRFMAALLKHYGHETSFIPVNDRPREVGLSKSDFTGRAIKGLFDLLGVMWLIHRTPAPLRGSEEILQHGQENGRKAAF